MAIDYYLEIKGYGNLEKKKHMYEFLLDEFSLTEHPETGIMTGEGLGISLFMDSDQLDDSCDSRLVPDLFLGFRVDKGQQQAAGYKLLKDIIRRIFSITDADLCLMEGDDDCVLLKRDSGNISRFFPEHELWAANVTG